MDINQSWNAALKLIEQEISSSIGFETWILPIVPVGIDGSRFLLQVSDNVCKEILEKRHLTLIRSALKNVTGINYDIVILTEGEKTPVHTTAEVKKEESGDVARNLNPKYVFSSFVVWLTRHPLPLPNLRQKPTTLYFCTETPGWAKPT